MGIQFKIVGREGKTRAGELVTHNWHQNYRLVKEARWAIVEGRFAAFREGFLRRSA